MKAIQFTIDEQLLDQVDQDPEVLEKGRSAFLRRAITTYLRAKRERSIREAYERGYGDNPPTEDELGPWPEVQAWPEQ